MEAKDIITTLGLDPAKVLTVDDLKASMESEWVRVDQLEKHPNLIEPIVNKKFGALAGTLEGSFIREIKGLGIELTAEEKKDKNMSDLFKVASGKLKSRIEELEKKTVPINDEQILALKSERDKIAKDYNDLKEINSGLVTEFTTFKDDLTKKEKANKINSAFDNSYKNFSFKDGMTPIEHKGFKTELNESYKFELDEKESLVIRDANDKLVMSKKVAGQQATLDEILSLEADKNNFAKKNVTKTGITTQNRTVTKPDDDGNGVVIGGRLRKIDHSLRESYNSQMAKK